MVAGGLNHQDVGTSRGRGKGFLTKRSRPVRILDLFSGLQVLLSVSVKPSPHVTHLFIG